MAGGSAGWRINSGGELIWIVEASRQAMTPLGNLIPAAVAAWSVDTWFPEMWLGHSNDVLLQIGNDVLGVSLSPIEASDVARMRAVVRRAFSSGRLVAYLLRPALSGAPVPVPQTPPPPPPPPPTTPNVLTVTSIPLFAPSAETCEIRYSLARGTPTLGNMVKLTIKDKTGATVYTNSSHALDGSNQGTFQWDGRGGGQFVSPLKSPFRIEGEMADDASVRDDAEVRVEVKEIAIEVVSPDQKLRMNDPAGQFETVATVKLKKSDNSGVVTQVPIDVTFTFSDPAPDNATKAEAYEYASPSTLGKRSDADAVYWAAHASSSGSSPDSYKTTAIARTIVATGADLGKAKVYFKPSGVGGDDFKLKAAVMDGTTEVIAIESNTYVVWRSIDFANVYTMASQAYLDPATVHAEIGPALETDAYVLYSRQAVHTLDAGLSVKHIGLYDSSAAGNQKNWPADFSPTALETSANELEPTAAELADYAYAGADAALVARKNAAKTAIEAKAQLWFNRIVDNYVACVSAWFTAAAVPSGDNALLAVEYYHPKLSNAGDGATNFWPAGISINLANPGSGVLNNGHPDQATWREVQGFNRGLISVIFKNYGTAARLQIICRHEIGHGTKSAFQRKSFGTGDHSASGLMTYYGASNTFSADDVLALRGYA